MKEWQAFNDLKKKIDDFNETCPLLELMANRSMKDRHWDRIAQLTGHTFDVHLDNFQLRNIMEASLLPHKDDIEDICVSAVKEKDIEAKLKQVGGLVNERWGGGGGKGSLIPEPCTTYKKIHFISRLYAQEFFPFPISIVVMY